jgi:hypothetical protein
MAGSCVHRNEPSGSIAERMSASPGLFYGITLLVNLHAGFPIFPRKEET